MTKGRPNTDTASPAPGQDRGERLSAALRANLARRKVQARARKGAQDAPGGGDGDKPGAGDRAGEGSHDSAGFIADKRTVE
jgi:hypothetical protein